MKIPRQLPDDVLLSLSLVMIIGAGVYYFYALNWPGLILSLLLSLAAFIWARPRFRYNSRDQAANDESARGATEHKMRPDYLQIGAYALSWLAALAILLVARSDRALITPWAVVSPAFFWFYALASLLLVLILAGNKNRAGLKLTLLSAHYFLSLAVALIVYKIGYGYDPFIHEAAMALIAAKGFVLPKPPYYLGEYGLIVIIHQLSGLSISGLDKILVPGLAALFLPSAGYRFLKNGRSRANHIAPDETTDNSAIFLAILFALGLSFSPFILTTPQNLSYLLLILTVLAGFGSARSFPVWLLALATTAIHPLTGLPAIAFAAVLSLRQHQETIAAKTRRLIKFVIFLGAALSLPLALFFSGAGNSFGGANLWTALTGWLSGLGTAGREDWLSNFVYFFADNYVLLIILAVAAALFSYRDSRRKIAAGRHGAIADDVLTVILPALMVAYLISGLINFNGLIDYEQNDYASRLPIIMLIFLLPFLLAAGREIISRILSTARPIRLIWLIFGLGLLNAALYVSYPRFDKYWNSRGYSTSRNDLTAVAAADAAAGGPYIALADQQVSAAALKEFGFDHYYQTPGGPIYFYPIPTGGPLYQYYLDMVYQAPDKKTMAAAMALAGVPRGYLLVNKYWYQSDRIIAAAKLAAEKWWTINNEIYIFQYSR